MSTKEGRISLENTLRVGCHSSGHTERTDDKQEPMKYKLGLEDHQPGASTHGGAPHGLHSFLLRVLLSATKRREVRERVDHKSPVFKGGGRLRLRFNGASTLFRSAGFDQMSCWFPGTMADLSASSSPGVFRLCGFSRYTLVGPISC